MEADMLSSLKKSNRKTSMNSESDQSINSVDGMVRNPDIECPKSESTD